MGGGEDDDVRCKLPRNMMLVKPDDIVRKPKTRWKNLGEHIIFSKFWYERFILTNQSFSKPHNSLVATMHHEKQITSRDPHHGI